MFAFRVYLYIHICQLITYLFLRRLVAAIVVENALPYIYIYTQGRDLVCMRTCMRDLEIGRHCVRGTLDNVTC